MDETKLTENNNVKVYNETTKPKKKRRDKSDLGENFVAPDGGWGWAVCIAAGLSNLSIFPCLQQYGLVYRQRLYSLGFKGSEISTIINIVMAVAALTGLLNGAMFRRFTFRQVAIVGGIFIVTGVAASAFCATFIQFILFFAVIFGIGMGINMSATSLAVNTYFRNKRRQATGYSWTITGFGPIIFPHITTAALYAYGVRGTILILAAISLNAIVAGMVLQPVLKHVKPQPKPDEETLTEPEPEYECKYCQAKKRKRSIFSSQYIFNDDDADRPGYEITEPCTPMLSRANDGWYGSKLSLASDINGPRKLQRRISSNAQGEPRTLPSDAFTKPNYFNREKEDHDRYASKASIYSKIGKEEFKCTCADEKLLIQKQIAAEKEQEKVDSDAAVIEKPLTFRQKIVIFFDLDLLNDFTFVNLLVGMTIILFGEINFSVLTPFILHDFKFTDGQISLAMSIIGGVDLFVRFLGPFVLQKIKLDNRVIFAFGIILIAIGRACVAHIRSYNILLGVFALIGVGKALRTIFAPLIIPSYVPLKRLPAASGLQLISNGIFTLACGPIIGIITDATSYVVSIHFINMLTFLALFSWASESIVRKFLRRNKERQMDEVN